MLRADLQEERSAAQREGPAGEGAALVPCEKMSPYSRQSRESNFVFRTLSHVIHASTYAHNN